LWRHDEGQDIAEYAVMLAVIPVWVVGAVRLIGTSEHSIFERSQFNSVTCTNEQQRQGMSFAR
jgi:Flp pilus assembly pilin Flp